MKQAFYSADGVEYREVESPKEKLKRDLEAAKSSDEKIKLIGDFLTWEE